MHSSLAIPSLRRSRSLGLFGPSSLRSYAHARCFISLHLSPLSLTYACNSSAYATELLRLDAPNAPARLQYNAPRFVCQAIFFVWFYAPHNFLVTRCYSTTVSRILTYTLFVHVLNVDCVGRFIYGYIAVVSRMHQHNFLFVRHPYGSQADSYAHTGHQRRVGKLQRRGKTAIFLWIRFSMFC